MKLRIFIVTAMALLIASCNHDQAPSSRYALLVGQLTTQKTAESLAQSITSAGISTQVIPARDIYKNNYWLVAAGNFSSVEQARAARTSFSNKLGMTGPSPVVLLPVRSSNPVQVEHILIP